MQTRDDPFITQATSLIPTFTKPRTMPFLALPNELLFMIADHLGARDLSFLILTSHTLYILFTPLLYDLGAQETYPTPHTALYWAAEHGQARLVEELLCRGAPVDGIAVRDNSTALHWAAKSGDEATIMLLLEWAVKNGRTEGEIEELLLRNLNAPDSKGEGPIFWAAKEGHEEVVRLLVERGAHLENLCGQLLLHEVIKAGYPGIARVLLENGADFRRSDQFGWVPLHCAARSGDRETMKILLDMGARVDELHVGYGATALHLAAKGGSEEVIRLLLDRGADVEARDHRCGATPLLWAAFSGNEAAVRYLLYKGADVTASCWNGNNILHLALYDDGDGHDAVVKLLLDLPECPDVNSQNHAGDTPLRWPVFKGYYNSVERMLKGGADIFILDKRGRSVLDCAEERLDFEMIKILARYGTRGWRQASSVNWKILCRVTPRLVGEAFEQKKREAAYQERPVSKHPVNEVRREERPVSKYPPEAPYVYIP